MCFELKSGYSEYSMSSDDCSGVGTRGTCPPNFSDDGDIICHVPLFIFGKISKISDVRHVLCEELFTLDVTHIAKLMMKQSLV